MRLHALAMRHRLAELSASGSGAAMEAELRSLGIVSPPRMLHLLAPWSSALCEAMSIPPVSIPPVSIPPVSIPPVVR
jgi:hypothetical protein